MQVPSMATVLNPELMSITKKETINNSIDVMCLETSEEYKSTSIYVDCHESDKTYVKFVKSIEGLIRSSNEMRKYMSYLKEAHNMDSCAFFEEVDKEFTQIELHHYPFTLFDITSIVLQTKIRQKKPYSTMSIAHEVVRIHYENIIGLVPVSKTAHELAHSGKLFIPIQKVYGNIEKFIQIYNVGMYSEHLECLKKLLEMSTQKLWEKNNDILEIKPVMWQLVQNGKPINDLNIQLEHKKEEGDDQ